MDAANRGQVTRSAADIYEEFFVPALFSAWTEKVLDRALPTGGDSFLDVACGTGVLARSAAERISDEGKVTGLDCNDGMLAVARRMAPGIAWTSGQAEDLPFPTDSFDAAASQFALMFFEDRVAALSEMKRVTKPGGRVVAAVWDDLSNTPGYAAMTRLLDRLFGAEAADALRAPYCLGDPDGVAGLFAKAGMEGATVERLAGKARFPSIASWVETDVKGWTLAEIIDDDQFALLSKAAETEFRQFVQADGSVEFDHPAIVATARA